MYTSDYVRSRVIDFLDKYGDKGYFVLKTIVDLALDPEIDHRLGDFSYKHLVFKMRRMGVEYSPQNLIRILEREYGIIEKTYISTTQKWWRLVDLETVRKALLEYNSGFDADDPELKLLIIKYNSLEPTSLLNALRKLMFKDSLTSADKELFRRLAFSDLETVSSLLKEMAQHEEFFAEELKVLREILDLAEKISIKVASGGRRVVSRKSVESVVYSAEREIGEHSVKPW